MTVATEYRPDCMERWRQMSGVMGDLHGKTLVDIGCFNGYFCEKFLEHGGEKAVGVEIDIERVKECSSIPHTGFSVVPALPEGKFDFCFFLDLQYHERIDLLQWCKDHAKVSFISPSGSGGRMNPRLRADLLQIFKTVTQVGVTSWADRMIYKCTN